MDEKVKIKNVLDLHFQKHLTIASTSVIIAFTYLIGISISFLTKQIKFDNMISISAIIIISIGILGICSLLFFNSQNHLKNIPKVVRNL